MSSTSSLLTGQVKWFNSKAGYGFITVRDQGELLDKDVFVHYSSIKADSSHYKYLTQGEYVEFTLTKPSGDKHEYHAVNVTGIRGGLIMCETRRLSLQAGRSEDRESGSDHVEVEVLVETKPRKVSRPRGPPATKDSEGFTTVKRTTKRSSK